MDVSDSLSAGLSWEEITQFLWKERVNVIHVSAPVNCIAPSLRDSDSRSSDFLRGGSVGRWGGAMCLPLRRNNNRLLFYGAPSHKIPERLQGHKDTLV